MGIPAGGPYLSLRLDAQTLKPEVGLIVAFAKIWLDPRLDSDYSKLRGTFQGDIGVV